MQRVGIDFTRNVQIEKNDTRKERKVLQKYSFHGKEDKSQFEKNTNFAMIDSTKKLSFHFPCFPQY